MYRLLKLENIEHINFILRTCERRPLFCNLCHPCFVRNDKIFTNKSKSAQYASAIKYLLSKKSKKTKKTKRLVEVMKATDTKIINATTSVDVIRGKHLTAFANQLIANTSVSNLHTTTRRLSFRSIDSTRNYDPLLVLPGDNVSENIPIESHSTGNNAKNVPPNSNKNYGISNFPLSITINDVISKLNQGAVSKQVTKTTNKSVPKKNLQKTKAPRKISTKPKQEQIDDLVLQSEEILDKKIADLVDAGSVSLDESVFSKSAVVEEEIQVENDSNNIKSKSNKGPKYLVQLKKKTREVIAKTKLSDLDRNRRQDNLNANFLSYVDVCVYNGCINHAFSSLKSYRKKSTSRKEWQPKVNNVDVYNHILMGYANEGNWQKMLEVILIIEEDNIKLNPHSYAAILNCLGRRQNKNHIKEYLNNIHSNNFELHDILNSSFLSTESQKYVIDAIKTVDEEFCPVGTHIKLNYDCSLLNHLNDQIPTNTTPLPSFLTAENIKEMYKKQILVEKNNYVKIKTIEKRSEATENVNEYREKLNEALSQWKTSIQDAFDRDLEILKSQNKHKSYYLLATYPYLMSIPREDHVEIILQEIRKLAEGSETYSPTTKQLYRDLGLQVFLRYQIKKKKEKGALAQIDELFMKYCDWYASPDSTALNTRQKWQKIVNEHCALHLVDNGDVVWKSNVLTEVGRFLYNIILRDVKIDVNVMRITSQKDHFLPAFYTLFRSKGHHSKEEVKPHPILSRLFRAAAPEHLVFEASKIPMLCPPLPWSSISSGGYLITKTELIRLPYQAIAQWKALEATPVNKLYPAFDSLNQLGAVPWTVNEEVLNVILTVFNSGGSTKLDVPQPQSAYPSVDPITPEMTSADRSKIYRQRIISRRRRAEMYSLWCDALYKLSLANHFRKEVFWLPHNMDFRGRVYPVAPHLNHLGSDLSRSLLIFAKGKELGPDGLDWLKIHTINLTGTHKKQSVQERLEYANEILDDILDSANKPLNGKMWWAESEEPWQTLAACMEVRNAIASGNPTTYCSRFPVHQDGSCNGLQHYAALGRDLAGGESVNLTPALVPQDVYSCVAAIVERERAKDAANGVLIAQELEGFIYRKVIKQTVMTTVYGVTRFGARLQIARQLKDLESFPKQHVWQASMYLVNKTFDSLQEMFTSTKEIQDWFTECARLIAQVCSENVEWVTPLGLPIVQPYSKSLNKTASDHLKFIDAQASIASDAFERPNIMKQKNAFAPNFIHSLDSSHMMLTSIVCESMGVTFVSVHDCYWTHASSVTDMNRVCRNQFVALHSHPILSDLSDFFIHRFSYLESSFCNDGSVADLAKRNLNRVLRELPRTGSLDLTAVLKSPYFFS